MTWTAMTDLSAGDLVTEAHMDAIRGNIEYLLAPNHERQQRTGAGDYTTTSTTFVDIDATNLACTITTYGGPVLVVVTGSAYHSAANGYCNFDIDVDGNREGGVVRGLHSVQDTVGGALVPVAFPHLVTGLSAGSHTFKLQWCTLAGTLTLLNTASYVAQISVIEL